MSAIRSPISRSALYDEVPKICATYGETRRDERGNDADHVPTMIYVRMNLSHVAHPNQT